MKFSSQVVVAVVSFLSTTAIISISASPMKVEVENDPIKIGNDPDELNPGDIQYVVGGDESEYGQYPYYVKLNQDHGFCGGSLIAPRVVLTAAHCQPQYNVGNSITVGPTDRYSLDNGDFQPARIIKTVDAVLHPNYNSDYIDYDFALVLLEEEYVLDSNGVQLVLNDESSVPSDGDVLDVLGMGTLASDGNQPNVLMDVQVESFNNSQCNSDFYSNSITENMICAGFEEGGKDSCQGDSGGPLVKVNGNTHTQVGVVSWGYGCAFPDFPGVYSRVSAQIDWMRDQICEEWEVESSLCGPRAPTPPPTPRPTSVPDPDVVCDAGSSNIEIVLNFDGFAEEISWSITDTDSNEYGEGSAYDRDDNYYNELVEPVTLCHSDCYEFEINDSVGDGMCDLEGCGSFEIVVQGDVVFRGGDVDILSVHKVSFCLDESGNVQPQSGENTGSGSSIIGVEVDFFPDDYPNEISWTISDTTSNSDIYGEESNYDALTLGGELVIESVTLWNNQCYEFVIQDSAGDGLCDSERSCGTYGIIVQDEHVYFEAGNFGNSDTFSLCLDDNGNFVEPLPECGDDFYFGWKGKDWKDCEWVAKQKGRGKNKCKKKAYKGKRGKIRDYCQETCNQC